MKHFIWSPPCLNDLSFTFDLRSRSNKSPGRRSRCIWTVTDSDWCDWGTGWLSLTLSTDVDELWQLSMLNLDSNSMEPMGQHRDRSMLGFRSGYKSFTNLPCHVFPTGLPPFSDSKIFSPDLLKVNQKLEQCAEDCIAKLLKSLAVRNQDRSSRLLKKSKSIRCF